MKNLKIVKKITRCIDCPFHWRGECGHPFFEGKAYECMIIDQENKDTIPDRCPLRKESVTTLIELK